MHIGLIGGIGPAATDYYYRSLIAAFTRRNTPLELTIVHADTPTLLKNLGNDDKDAQVAIYNRLTDRLKAAGADCVVVTSVAGHFCIEPFTISSALPVINLLQAVEAEIKHRGLQRLGIIGTRTVMQSRFYGGINTAEVIAPQGSELDDVHGAYVAMAASGQVTDEQRSIFDDACRWFMDEAGVDAIMLGGTDLALVYNESQSPFPLVDCAAIHVTAIVNRAIGGQSKNTVV